MARAIISAAFFARCEKNHQTTDVSAITPTAIADHFTIGRVRALTQVVVCRYCSINGSRFRPCAVARPLANVLTPYSKLWDLLASPTVRALNLCHAVTPIEFHYVAFPL